MISPRIPLIGLVALAIAAPAAAFALTGDAPSSTVSSDITFGNEAWYQINAICPAAGTCLSAAASYPANTLHITSTLGMEQARSYLGITSGSIPAGSTVTGGLLRLPLDTSAADGSLQPDSATFEVCTTTQPIQAVVGSSDTPPAADCSASAKATVIGAPATEYDVDMAPLAAKLSVPGTSLVLMSTPSTTSTFQVVLASNAAAPATGAATAAVAGTVDPPSLSLTYTPPTAGAAPVDTDPASPAALPSSIASAPAISIAGPLAPKPAPVVTSAAPPQSIGVAPVGLAPAAAPSSAPSPGPVLASVAALPGAASGGSSTGSAGGSSGSGAGAVTLGGSGLPGDPLLAAASSTRIYDYPAVFLLPILLGLGIVCFGRQLTRPLTRKQ